MIERVTVAAAGLALLGSCTLDFPTRATFEEGRLVFRNANEDERGPPYCWANLRVVEETQFGTEGRVIWAFEVDPWRSQNITTCALASPLTYGAAPEYAAVSVPARRPDLDQLYRIRGSAGGYVHGKFRLVVRDGQVMIVNYPD